MEKLGLIDRNDQIRDENRLQKVYALNASGCTALQEKSSLIHDGKITAVVVTFPLSEKAEIDQKSGKSFAQAMGLFPFLSRMPLFLRMEKMMPRVESSSGSYIHTISVDSEKRGGGIGSYGYSIWKFKSVPLLTPAELYSWGCVGVTGAFMFYHPATESHIIGTFNDFAYRGRASIFMAGKVVKELLRHDGAGKEACQRI